MKKMIAIALVALLTVFLGSVATGYAFGGPGVSDTMPFLSSADNYTQYWADHSSSAPELTAQVSETMPFLTIGGNSEYFAHQAGCTVAAGVSDTMPFLSAAGPEYGGANILIACK